MTPWDILAAVLATIIAFGFCFLSLAFLLIISVGWDEWRVERRERILKAEHRNSEL